MLTFESVQHQRLRDVSFRVRPGELVGVLSPYKPDRTTLLKLASGAERPEHGKVTANGRVIEARPHWPESAGNTIVGQLIFQQFGLKRSLPACRARALRALSEWELEDWSGQELSELEPYDLSVLALLRALIGEPDVLLVDGPVAGALLIVDRIRALLAAATGCGAAVLVTAPPSLDALPDANDLHTLKDGRLLSAPAADVVRFPTPA